MPKRLILTLFYILRSITCFTSRSPTPLQLFRNCLDNITATSDFIIIGQISDPNQYSQLNFQWNLRIPQVNPLAYFLPKSTLDVQNGVKCARQFNISIIPKSGGHSFEAYSFGTSKSIVIDLKRMLKVDIYSECKTATIQSGITVGRLLTKFYKTNNSGLGLSSGICLSVGLGGLSLGGGAGLVSNRFGLTLDNILEMTMVDARGDVHNVSEVENPDLFWALRGVGSGYIGIVTEFKFKLFQASTLRATLVRMKFGFELFQFLRAWQDWLVWADQNDPTVFSVGGFSSGRIGLYLAHYQDKAAIPSEPESDKFLEAIRRIFPTPNYINVTYHPYIDLVEIGTEAFSLPENDRWMADQDVHIKPLFYKRKSFMVDQLIPPSKLEILANLARNLPEHTTIHFERSGGAIREVLPNATAYVHRKAFYIFGSIFKTENIDDKKNVKEGLAFVEKFWNETQFMNTGRTYQNYVDGELHDFGGRYYGGNFKRLKEIKKKWDPTNYFQNRVSIPID